MEYQTAFLRWVEHAEYDQIGDKHRKGAAHDTKAQIYVSEGKYEEAIVYATEAIAILKDGVNMSVIAEAYMTKARALIYVEDIAEATVNLHSAMEIARVQVGDDGVSVLAKEFEQILLEKNRYDENIDEEQEKIFKGEFELILPASLAGYMNCDVVRIRNSHLEKEGLPKGALALVANEEVKRGNIVALKELSDDSIVCGYYDHFAEIVSLSRPGEDDLLYKAEEIEVLGKVIGAGIEDGVSNSKILIKPINS